MCQDFYYIVISKEAVCMYFQVCHAKQKSPIKKIKEKKIILTRCTWKFERMIVKLKTRYLNLFTRSKKKVPFCCGNCKQ